MTRPTSHDVWIASWFLLPADMQDMWREADADADHDMIRDVFQPYLEQQLEMLQEQRKALYVSPDLYKEIENVEFALKLIEDYLKEE